MVMPLGDYAFALLCDTDIGRLSQSWFHSIPFNSFNSFNSFNAGVTPLQERRGLVDFREWVGGCIPRGWDAGTPCIPCLTYSVPCLRLPQRRVTRKWQMQRMKNGPQTRSSTNHRQDPPQPCHFLYPTAVGPRGDRGAGLGDEGQRPRPGRPAAVPQHPRPGLAGGPPASPARAAPAHRGGGWGGIWGEGFYIWGFTIPQQVFSLPFFNRWVSNTFHGITKGPIHFFLE